MNTIKGLSAMHLKTWRTLRDVGGWNTAGQIAGAMGEKDLLTHEQTLEDVQHSLDVLYHCGCLYMRSRSGRGSAWEYGITGSVTPPEGESLEPLGSTPPTYPTTGATA